MNNKDKEMWQEAIQYERKKMRKETAKAILEMLDKRIKEYDKAFESKFGVTKNPDVIDIVFYGKGIVNGIREQIKKEFDVDEE